MKGAWDKGWGLVTYLAIVPLEWAMVAPLEVWASWVVVYMLEDEA